MIRSIAVTGATGFVGRHLVNNLVNKGYNVRCLSRNTKTKTLNKIFNNNVELCEIDWESKESIRKAINGVDAIVHAAAIHPIRSMQNEDSIIQFNVKGTRKLLESIECLDRFIMVSSMRTLVNQNSAGIFDENSNYDFKKYDTPYGYSKYLSEKVCLEFMEKKDIPLIIVNPTAIIGPGDIGPSPNGELIRGLLKSPMNFMVDTNFSFVDVRDVANAIEKLLHYGEIGKKYPLCAANWPVRTFIKKIHQAAGLKKPIVAIPMPIAYSLGAFFEFLQLIKPDMTAPVIRSSIHFARLNPIFDGSKITEIGCSYIDPDETVRESVKWILENYPLN